MIIIQQIKKLRNYYLRTIRFRHYSIGPGFHAGARVRIWGKKRVTIGRNFYIGRDSFIESNVIIGNNVIWANRVALVGRYDHHYQQIGVPTRLASQIRDKDYTWKGIDEITVIEDDVWIGYNTTILSGVNIGEGSIIAASSLITKDIEPYAIYAGTPARRMKNRFDTPEDLQQHLIKTQSKYLNKLTYQ